MKNSRKRWNARQKQLRSLLKEGSDFPKVVELFLQHHAEVHAERMSSFGGHSFVDEALEGLTESQLRRVPERMEHSIAWILWHLARIEDVTMNLLVAGKDQVLLSEDWGSKLGVSILHTGNAMSRDDILELSKEINLDALRNYRVRVGRETETIVKRLTLEDLKRKPSLSQLERLRTEGAVIPQASGLIEYWSKRSVAGLLLMPPTRHCFVHLNEASEIRKRIA